MRIITWTPHKWVRRGLGLKRLLLPLPPLWVKRGYGMHIRMHPNSYMAVNLMGLKVWLPLNGDLHNLGCSNPNITLVSGNTWASSGKIGNSSLTLTKLLTILPNSSCMSGVKEISYCYWVKVNTAWSANWLDGIRWTETNGSATSTARQEFYTNCTLIGTWYKGGSISGKSFTPGAWTHLTATINYNTGEAKFYINGALSGTTTNVDTTYYCRGDFYIGDSGTDICENDVRIYDHCLSAAEIKEISLGLVLHYKLDDLTNDIVDSSGYNYNGSLLGTPTLNTDTARYSHSTNFSANADGILSTFPIALWNNTFTYSFWIKPSNENSGRSIYAASYSGTSCSIEKTTGNKLRFYWNGSPDLSTSSLVISDGSWLHIAIVKEENKTTVKCYYNGELKDTFTNTFSDKTFTGSLRIARDTRSDSTAYIGLMSDFRIYCTALSAEDIKQLCELGAKIDNKLNLHVHEIKETNANLLAGKLWTGAYSQHNPLTSHHTNFNANGEYQFTVNNTSAGSEYIPISPTGHTYEYDYTISVNAGNQFYIGFERYDSNKTSRSNNACIYTFSSKPSSDIVKLHYTGTVNLSTDGVNPCAYITLRILNGWSGTTSGVTGQATIHNISLRQIGTKQVQKLNTLRQFIEEEIKEETNTKILKNGMVSTNQIIEF